MNNNLVTQVFLIDILGFDVDSILKICNLIKVEVSKRSVYRWLRAEQEINQTFLLFLKMAFDYFKNRANAILNTESYVVILPYYSNQDDYALANKDLLSNVQVYNAFLKLLFVLNEHQKQPKTIVFDTENVYAKHELFINPKLDFKLILSFF